MRQYHLDFHDLTRLVVFWALIILKMQITKFQETRHSPVLQKPFRRRRGPNAPTRIPGKKNLCLRVSWRGK